MNQISAALNTICVFGLGEAGSLFAADLVAAGIEVHGFDPKDVATPPAVIRHDNPQDAVANVDMIIALTAAADAETALQQAYENIPGTALYADFSTAAAGLKHSLSERCAQRAIDFCDVALMAVVPGKGIKTPALASGSGAPAFSAAFAALGMPVQAISDQAGDAATRKLLRSVMMKGLAAVVIEAMQAAEQAGCAEWLWENMANEISNADELLLTRLVKGTRTHALRRLHEMQASVELLESLHVDPLMTRATAANLQMVLENWPNNPGSAEKLPGWWSIPGK